MVSPHSYLGAGYLNSGPSVCLASELFNHCSIFPTPRGLNILILLGWLYIFVSLTNKTEIPGKRECQLRNCLKLAHRQVSDTYFFHQRLISLVRGCKEKQVEQAMKSFQ